MQQERLKGFLNICRKANYLIIGGEKLENYNKKLFLIIYDKSAKESTIKIASKFLKISIPVIAVENLDKLLSIKNCKIIGIKNKNLSEIIKNICEEKE